MLQVTFTLLLLFFNCDFYKTFILPISFYILIFHTLIFLWTRPIVPPTPIFISILISISFPHIFSYSYIFPYIMGVPSFYHWLAEKYPLTISNVIEEEEKVIDDVRVSIDTTKSNPNNLEYSNLYLHMNGIIHPCFCLKDCPSSTTYAKVFQSIFDYMDCIFAIV